MSLHSNQNYSRSYEGDSSKSQGSENLVDIREEQVIQSIQRISSLYPQLNDSKKGVFNNIYLSITAIGVIFGDIGTSPLYVFASMFNGPPDEKQVIGSLSLILWALIMVVSFKYVIFILNADNNGEGGIIALVSLLPNRTSPRLKSILTLVSICGASFILGDGVITPAISLLSAVEGLEVGLPGGEIKKWIVPITVVILFVLFSIQSFGTESIGIICGPVMILWFFSIGIFGLLKVIDHPVVLKAFNPWKGIEKLFFDGPKGFLLLGTVILCVTGCEALYADLGHTGKKPIRLAWFCIAMPALMLNYLGQGALYIESPNTKNPFFELISSSFFWPMIILATLACIIASQSLITGSFSIINQAISLKFFPPLRVVHTSKKISGQVYIAQVNYVLGFLTLITVIGFKHSTKLIGAYGLGVALVMVATTILYIFVLRLHFKYSMYLIVPLGLCFIIMDGLFFSASIEKIPTGGWFPVIIAFVLSSIMIVWRIGTKKMVAAIHDISPPLSTTLEQSDLQNRCGGAVFMSHYQEKTPLSLVKLSPFLTSMPYPLFFITINHLLVPYIKEEHRFIAKELVMDKGVYSVSINYGYAEVIDVPAIIRKLFIENINLNKKLVSSTSTRQSSSLEIPKTNKELSSSTTPTSKQINYHYGNGTQKLNENGEIEIEMELEGLPKLTYFLSRERVYTNSSSRGTTNKFVFFFKRISTFLFDLLLQNSRVEAHYYGLHHNSIMEIGNKIKI